MQAVVETLLAMAGLGLWLYRTQEWKYLFAPSCVAIVLLLRTEMSTNLGLQFWQYIERASDEIDHWQDKDTGSPFARELRLWLGFVAFFFGRPLAAVAVRITATVRIAACHPLASLAQVPRNWQRVALSIDTWHPPEQVPGIETADAFWRHRFWNDMRAALHSPGSQYADRSAIFRRLVTVGWLVQACCIYVPAIAYRLSLKSTGLLWSPLLWFVSIPAKPRPADQRLRLFLRSPFVWASLAYSVVVIIAFIAKVAVYDLMTGSAERYKGTFLEEVICEYAVPGQIPLWQLFMFANAVLLYGISFFARHQLVRLEEGMAFSPSFVNVVMRTVLVLRNIVTLYVCSCTFYITGRLALNITLPPLGTKVFPWQ